MSSFDVDSYFLCKKREKEREEQQKREDEERITTYNNMTVEEKEELRKKIFAYSVIDYMLEKGYQPHIYNGCYGGPGMSYEASHLVAQFIGDDIYNIESTIIECRVIQYLGDRANCKGSCPCIAFFKSEFSDFVSTREYDGLETLKVNMEKYKIKRTEQILDSTLSSDEKIEEIRRVYKEKHQNIAVKYAVAFLEFNSNTGTAYA